MAEEQKPINGEKAAPLVTIKLRQMIQAHGDELHEISFREPTVMDIIRFGNPVTLDMGFEPPKIVFDEGKMAGVMSALAAVPPSAIASMHPKDFINAVYTLAPFFLPDRGTS